MQERNRTSLTARSVLASTMLGVDPPELPVSYLVRMASLFGINENRARVALSRMVASGEATTGGDGRYRLSGHLLGRQRRQDASRGGTSGPWSGSWHVVLVTTAGSTAEVRGHRRRALTLARLGEVREGAWARPDNLPLDLGVDVGGDVVVMNGAVPGNPAGLAARLFDLPGWALRAEELMAAMSALRVGRSELAVGFELSAAVLRHFQADPLLPPALLPDSWPGRRLRSAYDAWDLEYRRVLAEWAAATPDRVR
jgi:phenylacetic acid degradation operon negative regulatory protein